MQTKSWESKIDALTYFEDVRCKGAFLLLSDKGGSKIGLEPCKYFVSTEAVQAHFLEFPESTIMGYKSYPNKSSKKSVCDLPPELWIAFKRVIEIEKKSDTFKYKEIISNYEARESLTVDSKSDVKDITFIDSGEISSTISKDSYLKTIDQIKDEISNGEYYQMNLTFFIKKNSNKNPFDTFKDYFKKNPAQYFAYFEWGECSVLSTSPEMFLEKKNDKISAKPIKGTISKTKSKTDLLESKKDLAELNMITDLFRNDLYKISKKGSVTVLKTNEVLELEQLFHLYSHITGKLQEDVTLTQIFEAMFPSGSITGCPKIRSQQAIDQYEVAARGLYTGSIGWIKKDAFCFNIAIRTLFHHGNTYFYPVGSGIVYDSKPESEWEECLLKAQTFFECV